MDGLGDQLINDGDGSIKMTINGVAVEFKVLEIPGHLTTKRVTFKPGKQVQP